MYSCDAWVDRAGFGGPATLGECGVAQEMRKRVAAVENTMDIEFVFIWRFLAPSGFEKMVSPFPIAFCKSMQVCRIFSC